MRLAPPVNETPKRTVKAWKYQAIWAEVESLPEGWLPVVFDDWKVAANFYIAACHHGFKAKRRGAVVYVQREK